MWKIYTLSYLQFSFSNFLRIFFPRKNAFRLCKKYKEGYNFFSVYAISLLQVIKFSILRTFMMNFKSLRYNLHLCKDPANVHQFQVHFIIFFRWARNFPILFCWTKEKDWNSGKNFLHDIKFPEHFMNEALVWWLKASNKQNSGSSQSLKFYENLEQSWRNQLNECTANGKSTHAHKTSLVEGKIQKFPLLTRKH